MSDKKNRDKKRKKFRREIKSGRVEKTFQVVTEKSVVKDGDEVSTKQSASEITLRDVDTKSKRKQKQDHIEQSKAKREREEQIKLSAAQDEPDGEEQKPEISLEGSPQEDDGDKENSKKEKKSKDKVTDIRAARKREKNKKRVQKIIIFVIVAAFAAAVYLLREKWVPKLEGILDRPHDTIVNDGKTLAGNFPLTFDEDAVSAVSYIDNYLVYLDKNKLCIFDESGTQTNSYNHNYADPVLKTAQKRMLIYDKGGNSFMVVNRKNEMFSKETSNKILMAEIADNSYSAVVTQDDKYESVLTVYDENGSKIYTWSSSSRILSITMSDDGEGCFVTTFTSKGGELESVVRYMRFDCTEEIMKSEPLDMLALKAIENDDGDFWVVGDVSFCKLDENGSILFECEYDSQLVDYDLSGECAAVVLEGVTQSSAQLMIFESYSDKQGADSEIYSSDGSPKKLYVEDSKIILLKDSTVEAYDISGNLLATAEVSPEYFDFTFFNDNVYFLDYREINKIAFST